ncbi:5-hydroxytryptamine receptor 1B [Folsomia candida]|uniref:5-hydroxytryptamine receptor 1B n=1 Tax=Folsomia candida TaxID=158441 RepID=A0A226DHG2_FOLCA|nr:5-hydroxytryptamine receptor 1B [Folsomia candida]
MAADFWLGGWMKFVLSLVTANILISSIIAPLMLFEGILNTYLTFPCLTEVISMIGSSVIFAAIFSTFLIATDRFYAVTSPLHYSMTITRSRSQLMIVAAWLAGALLALPYVLICSLPRNTELHQSLHVLFIVLQLALGYLFPFVGLCWLYLRMYNAAHRNSERTRKHSISGDLLTVMDGSTSVIPPQGIDFLTHYINPFTKGMVGSAGAPPGSGGTNTTSIGQIVPAAVKKQRRRSSNGSSSSLLFREEGRAIKTAMLVLASFLVCWTPHCAFMLISEIDVVQGQLGDLVFLSGGRGGGNASNTSSMMLNQQPAVLLGGTNWPKFFGVFGILLSCLLNPFIYVFRNKMACKEVSKLLCRFFREKRRRKEDTAASEKRAHQLLHNNSRDRSDSTPSAGGNDLVASPTAADLDYTPKFTPCIGKSPKRSSLKSLTPQSSLNSTFTMATHSPICSSNSTAMTMMTFKPPFLRSMTVPEQTQPRVKFPPNLIRQKSCVHRPVYGAPTELTPALSKKFVRQDSICSILSNDSVLMICAEDNSLSASAESGLLNSRGKESRNGMTMEGMRCGNGCVTGGSSSLSGGSGCTPLPLQKHYLRQDSNFSDASHKTNDSGVVVASAKVSATNSPYLPHRQHSSPSQLTTSHNHLTPTHTAECDHQPNNNHHHHHHHNHHQNGGVLQTTI